MYLETFMYINSVFSTCEKFWEPLVISVLQYQVLTRAGVLSPVTPVLVGEIGLSRTKQEGSSQPPLSYSPISALHKCSQALFLHKSLLSCGSSAATRSPSHLLWGYWWATSKICARHILCNPATALHVPLWFSLYVWKSRKKIPMLSISLIRDWGAQIPV